MIFIAIATWRAYIQLICIATIFNSLHQQTLFDSVDLWFLTLPSPLLLLPPIPHLLFLAFTLVLSSIASVLALFLRIRSFSHPLLLVDNQLHSNSFSFTINLFMIA